MGNPHSGTRQPGVTTRAARGGGSTIAGMTTPIRRSAKAGHPILRLFLGLLCLLASAAFLQGGVADLQLVLAGHQLDPVLPWGSHVSGGTDIILPRLDGVSLAYACGELGAGLVLLGLGVLGLMKARKSRKQHG